MSYLIWTIWRVAQILIGSQVNSRTLQESTMLYVLVKPAAIKTIEEHISIPYT